MPPPAAPVTAFAMWPDNVASSGIRFDQLLAMLPTASTLLAPKPAATPPSAPMMVRPAMPPPPRVTAPRTLLATAPPIAWTT